MREIARDVAVIPTLISNAYLVGNAEAWVLVDALIPANARTIRQAAEARFGYGKKPRAIVLTHGHFDHAGSAAGMADFWGVKIYAHPLERPYLTGRSSYPPLDRTAPGFFSGLSRAFPSRTVNLGERLLDLDSSRPLPWLEGWDCYFTPGHSPGHTAFFRRTDRVLLAGDAVTTMNLDSLVDTIAKRPCICRPPVPGTINWEQARSSVQQLATLEPSVVAAGHGEPICEGATAGIRRLAEAFPIPEYGRYASEPALTDENGITYLPPAPFDPVPKIAAGVAAAVMAGMGIRLIRRKRSR